MEVLDIAIHIDIFQHLHKLQSKDRSITLDDYERLGGEAAERMAKGYEKNSPRAAKAVRRLADANVALGRTERDITKARNEREKQDLRLLKINEELAAQERQAASDAAKRERIQARADRQRDRSARAAKSITEQQYQLTGQQRDQARGINEVRQSQLDLTEARKSGLFTAKELGDEEQRIRNLQRENATRARDITLASKDLERTRREAARTTQLLGKHENTLNNIKKDAADRTREQTKLTDEETRVRNASLRSTEEHIRAREREASAVRTQRNAIMDYKGALDDVDRKHGRGGRGGGGRNVAGQILTDLPFVPGGRAGAAIGLPLVAILASLAEAAVTASQSLAVLPAVAAAGGAALGTLALGTMGFGNALKNMGDPKKFAEALQGLSPAAQQAALEIQYLVQGPLKSLKNSTQDKLFAGVPAMIHNATNTLLPPTQQLTTGLAGSMNNMFGNILGQLTSPGSLKSLETIINNIVTAFQHLEPAVAPFISALTKITEVGSTFLPGFADAITRAANSFNEFITKAQQDGSLRNFIQKGIDAAVELKNTIVDVGKRIYQEFGNKSPEEFRNTLHSAVDAAFAVAGAIVGISHVINDLLGPIQHVADALGGWEHLIKVAGLAFIGFKLLGISAGADLSKSLAAAGGTAGTGFASKFSGVLRGFGWVALGTFIGIEIANAMADKINQTVKDHVDQNFQTYDNAVRTGIKPPVPGVGDPGGPPAPGQTGPQRTLPPPLLNQLRDKINSGQMPPGFSVAPDGSILAPGGVKILSDLGKPPVPPSAAPSPNAGLGPPQTFNVPGVPGSPASASDRRMALENQFANDPRFNVDPFAGMPGGPPGISPQTGPVSPGGQSAISYRQTNPYEKGSYGVYNVDPEAVARETYALQKAGRELGDAEKKIAIAEQLRRENLVSEQDVIDAKQARDDKQQALIEQQWALNKAQTGTWDKINNSTRELQGVQQQIGAKIDDDFGISKGLPGIFENLFKVIANLAMAPVIGALTGITNVYGTAGPGTGLLGMLSEGKSMFGPTPNIFGQFTDPDTIKKLYENAPPGYAPPGTQSSQPNQSLAQSLFSPGSPGTAQPGESARDFAHRVMMPFWQNQGFQVGDHAADQYHEHQNGALDIMVPNIAAGMNVLQQVLSDPNIKGAIFNRQSYGYGHGLQGQPYTGDNPHTDHVHAFYQPGDPNDIKPTGAPLTVPGTYPGTTGLSSAGSGVIPVFVTNMPGGGGPGYSDIATGRAPGGALPGPGGSLWDQVMPHEGGTWNNQDTGKSGHFGGLQFSPATWKAFGGVDLTGKTNPAEATREQQIEIANRTAFTGYNGTKPQGLQAWEAITTGKVPGVTTGTPASAFTGSVPQGGQGLPLPLSPANPFGGPSPSPGRPGTDLFAPGGILGGMPKPPPYPGTTPDTATPGGQAHNFYKDWYPGPGPGTGPVGAPPATPGANSTLPGTQPFGPINSTGTSYTPAYGRSYAEGRKPSEGLSFSGLASMAGGAAGAMPGMGQLAQIGIEEINRAIQAGAQLGGNAVEGLMETFLPVESELADPARGWFGRILGAVAGVKPVAQNIAGMLGGSGEPGKPGEPGQPPLTPEQVAAQRAQDHLGQGTGSPGQPNPVNVNINNTKAPPDLQTTVTPHQTAANRPPGRVGP